MSRKSAPLNGLLHVVGDRDLRSRLGGDRVGQLDDLVARPERLRARDPDVHPELRTADQVGVGHVEAGVAQVAEDDLVQRLGHVLAEGEEVGEDLRRVPLIGETVVDGDAGVLGELLGHVLAEAAVLDRVVHAAEHPGSVLHRLLVAHVRAARPDEGDVGALVVGGDLERAARPGRVLLEDQRDLLADELLLLAPFLLGRLQLAGEVDQVGDLLGAEVGQLQEVLPAQVGHRGHCFAPFLMPRGRSDRSCSGRRRDRGRAPGLRSRAPRPRPWRASRWSPRCARRRLRPPARARRRCCRRPTGSARPRTHRLPVGTSFSSVSPRASCTSSRNDRSETSACTPAGPPGVNRIGLIWETTGS